MNAIDESIAWHKRQQGRATSGIAFVAGYEMGAASVRSQEHPDTIALRECRAELAVRSKRADDWAADLADAHEALQKAESELSTVQGFYEVECERTVKAVERMLAAERSESALQAQVARAAEELEAAQRVSGNRWSEWGSRGESVAGHIERALEELR